VAGERRAPASAEAQRALLTTFIAAARSGDMAGLERLFAADVTSVSDGNGRAGVARRRIMGLPAVTRFMNAISLWFWDDLDVRWVSTNGQTSAVLRRGGAEFGVLTVGATAEGIDRVLWMLNPEKITAVSDARESSTVRAGVVPGHRRRLRKS
jgi:RNA polymerase sigma-70 factor (ECF subfamily)